MEEWKRRLTVDEFALSQLDDVALRPHLQRVPPVVTRHLARQVRRHRLRARRAPGSSTISTRTQIGDARVDYLQGKCSKRRAD